jgi:ArsR family transcriptional regulator
LSEAYIRGVKLIAIYKCLCDETRLRILSLLSESPLCVCHIQQVLGKSQVVISQHLAYLRERSMVAGQRYQHWMIYSLPPAPSPELEANLRCLQDCIQTEPLFQKDRVKLKKLMGTKSARALLDEGCCAPPARTRRAAQPARKLARQ